MITAIIIVVTYVIGIVAVFYIKDYIFLKEFEKSKAWKDWLELTKTKDGITPL